MDLINTLDTEFNENVEDIIKNAQKKVLNEMPPTLQDRIEIYKIILKYIKDNKRKIYGGYAINMLLKTKGKEIYTDEEFQNADVDFYSNKPLVDLKNICDILYEKGYKNVMGKEAQHEETYVIYCDFAEFCNISYVPTNVYTKLRFIKINDYYVTHPWVIMIDQFRIFTNFTATERLIKKTFTRFKLLQSEFPLPSISTPLLLPKYKNKNITKFLDIFFNNFLITQPSIIITGLYAYNYYLYESKIKENYVNINNYELYSVNYINDGLNIIDFIKGTEFVTDIFYEEHFPFFQLFGSFTIFYFKDGDKNIPIITLYSNNKRCLPYKNITAYDFNANKELKNTVNIGSFDFNVLHILSYLIKIRVDDDNDKNDIYYKILNGYVRFRNYFLSKNKKTIYSNTIFQSFSIDCLGKTYDSKRLSLLKIKNRKKLKKATVYRYEPQHGSKTSTYYFKNSSGNKINNPSQLQLLEIKRHIDINEEEDEYSDDEEKLNDTNETKDDDDDENLKSDSI